MISDRLTPSGRALAFACFVFFFAPAFTLAVKEWRTVYEWTLPVTRWVDFSAIEIPDYAVGEDPMMENHRAVYKPILVDYAVEITNAETGEEVCQGGGKGIQMQPTETDTWKGAMSRFIQNKCHTKLPPGRYFAEMLLCFYTPAGVERCLPKTSNTFEVLP